MWLLAAACFGLIVPNGLFVYWLLTEFTGLALALLTVYFARHPNGRVRWPWFVAFSQLGGLGFSLPFYYWINHHARTEA